MKTISTLGAFFLVLLLFGCKEGAKEADVNVTDSAMESPKTIDEKWEVLFDGTNFDQWRGYLMDEMPAEWTIEEGAMAFVPGENGGKNIISKNQYTNFVLSLEWRIAEGGNSGIFWGVHEDPKFPEAYQTGPEIQVLDDEKHPDALQGNGTHVAGSLFDMIAPSEKAVNPSGEWNLCEISINHITNEGSVTLNGVNIVNFPVHGEGWNALVANSKFKDWEGFGQYPTGHIALQDHGDRVWYRNIKIKSLD